MKRIACMIVMLLICAVCTTGLIACAERQNATSNVDSAAAANGATSNPAAQHAGEGNKVYFAGPLFNQAEKDYNLMVAAVLEEYGYQVFLPQRDGIEAALLEGKTEQEMVDMIFTLDVGNVAAADIIFMNLDGRVPDEGACVELGLGYAQGKRCYGFKTDTRSVELGMDLNPMISGCMIKIFSNFDGPAMVAELRQYLSTHQL